MLLQTALVITMTGLMTHVGDDQLAGPDLRKKSVAIVAGRDHTHHPEVLVRKCFRADVNEEFRYSLEPGDRISFEGGGVDDQGYAVASSDFIAHTPSLIEPFTNSVVDERIRARQPHKKVVAWLDYPQGDLDVAWYHFAEAKFKRGDDLVRTQCVPKATWFAATTTGEVIMKIQPVEGRARTVTLKQSALIEISNSGDSTTASNHFSNYGGLVARRYGIMMRKVAHVEVGQRCGLDTHVGPILTSDLATLIDSRDPAIAAALRGPCKGGTIGPGNNDHPACTNTDWP